MPRSPAALLAPLALLALLSLPALASAASEPPSRLAASPAPRAGDAGPVRVLSAPGDLEQLRSCPSCSFQLAADIDLGGAAWAPVPSFSGVLNGMGHSILGVALAPGQASGDAAGFFARTEGATLIDLVIELATAIPVASTPLSAVGGLVGAARDTRFYGVYAKGQLSLGAEALAAGASAGGVVGTFDYEGGAFDDIYTNVALTVTGGARAADLAVGGVVGSILSSRTARNLNCGASVAVSVTLDAANTEAYVGGLLGRSADQALVLYNCRCPGASVAVNVNGGVAYVGSVAGEAAAGSGLRTGTRRVECISGGASAGAGASARAGAKAQTSLREDAPAACVVGGLVGRFTGRGEVYSYDLRSAAAVVVSCSGPRGCLAGGLVGRSDQNIRNSSGYSSLSVSGAGSLVVGGVVGQMTADFADVAAFGTRITVTGDGAARVAAGGLAGAATSTDAAGQSLRNCLSRVATLTVSGTATDVHLGGLLGLASSEGGGEIRIRDSAAYHTTLTAAAAAPAQGLAGLGEVFVGGLLGSAAGADLDHCFAIGEDVGADLSEATACQGGSGASAGPGRAAVGGLLGRARDASVTHSFAQAARLAAASCAAGTGAVFGPAGDPVSRVGGFVGATEGAMTADSCYANAQEIAATGAGVARLGGFFGASRGLRALSCFSLCPALSLEVAARGGDIGSAAGLFGGELSGSGASLDGCWARGAASAGYGANPRPGSPDGLAALALGGFLGLGSGGPTLSACYAQASLGLDEGVEHVAGSMVGLADGLNAYSVISRTAVSAAGAGASALYDLLGALGDYQAAPYGFHSCIMTVESGIVQASALGDGVFAEDPAALSQDSTYQKDDFMRLGFAFSDPDCLWAKASGSPPVLRRLPFAPDWDPAHPEQGPQLSFSSVCDLSSCWGAQGWALAADLFSGKPYFAPGQGGPVLCDSYLSGCRGTVVDPLRIDCKDGLRGQGCDRCSSDAGCSDHGTCNTATGVCTCDLDWSSFLCDTPKCYTDAVTGEQCGEGSCQRAGDFFKCVCPNTAEYTLANGVCRRACPGFGNAVCISDNWGDGSLSRAVCYAGYGQDSLCTAFDCGLMTADCGGLGTCDAGTGECYCADRSEYYDHAEARCVAGCSSLDPEHGACVEGAGGAPEVLCFNGWTGDMCQTYNCALAKTDVCGGLGSCVAGACACVAGAVLDQPSGTCRPSVEGCQHGVGGANGACVCEDGWADPAGPAVRGSPAWRSTSAPRSFGRALEETCSVFNCASMESSCGDHGDCDADTGECTCDPDSTRYWGAGSCHQDCPGMLHGQCLPMGAHRCEQGWHTASESKGYCDVYNCQLAPEGATVCSGHGVCGVSGCRCDPGFVLINGTCNSGCPGREGQSGTCLGDGVFVCAEHYVDKAGVCAFVGGQGFSQTNTAVTALAVLFTLAIIGLIVVSVFLGLSCKRKAGARSAI